MQIQIKSLAVGGTFAGRVTEATDDETMVGMTAFVLFGAPGETVAATLTDRKSRFLNAKFQSVVGEPSPERIEPRCPYFGRCGGCDIQHLNYSAQLEAKHEMVRGAFRSGGFGEDVLVRIEPTVASEPYGYRRIIILHVGKNGDVGYYRRVTHDLLSVTQCPIAVPVIEEILARGVRFEGAIPPRGSSLLIEAGVNGVFGTLFIPQPEDRREKPPTAKTMALWQNQLLQWFVGGAIVHGESGTRYGKGSVQHVLGDGGTVWATPGLFLQRNQSVNAALVARIRAFAKEQNAQVALDLYSGAGNFALSLAGDGLNVTAVETEPELTKAGEQEATRRDLGARTFFICGTTERFLPRQNAAVDLIVADPPRAGLGKLVAELPHSKAVALVSCDLASAVRDVKALIASADGGYEIQTIVPHDMFAQSGHIEVLTLLTRTRTDQAP